MQPLNIEEIYNSKLFDDIRKFGLAYSDLPTIVDNLDKLLRVITLNVNSKNKNPIPLPFYFLTIVGAASYIYVYVISATWFVIRRCIPDNNIINAVIIFSLAVSSEMGNAKFIFLYLNRNTASRIVKESLKFDATIAPGSRYSETISKIMRRTKMRAMFFWFAIMGNGCFYCSKAILTPGRHFMQGLYTLYGLEPMENTPNYEIGYTLTVVSVWFLCYVPANVTAMIIVLAGYIQAHMTALAQELLQLCPLQHYQSLDFSTLKRGSFVDANYKKQILNEFVNEKLKDIIRKHTIVRHLLNLLEKTAKNAIALEYILLMMALIADLLGGLKDTYDEAPYALVQVAMDCWTGQGVIDAGVAFEAAVYASNWEEFDAPNMKIVLMMLGNAQKTMKLSAGGVTVLSFSSLMSVMKSIYSAYTALQSAMK